jgi:rfaE bifunctional protein nucleotidyltransferase chain/domain
VAAALSLSLVSGASLEEAMIIANHAAGISVSKVGTYHVKLEELKEKLLGEEKKVKTFEELSNIVADLKRKGKKIVWTNGKFDILHEGHAKYLKEARKFGNCLIAGLNSDSSFKMLKGREPINSELKRAELLSAYVDYILIFPEQDTIKYLSAFKPDIYAKGGDYTIDTINQEERKIIENYGGQIVLINSGEDISTTKLLGRITDLGIGKEIKYVQKEWGQEIWMANSEKYCGKKLLLKRGKRCSMHYHKIKDETFYIESGEILIEIGNETRIMEQGEVAKISPGVKHRFSGLKDSVIIEISTTHDEEDSYRTEGMLSGDIPREIKLKYGIPD